MGDESGTYPVGYGKPPAEHRFQKGQSGNPKGRPKGARNQPLIDTRPGRLAAEAFLRFEAYRPISVREDGKVVQLPMIQALIRTMGVSALKGNRLALKALTELIMATERSDIQEREKAFRTAAEYKNAQNKAIQQARAAGRPEPARLPHPDDIILNPHTGDFRIEGPQIKEEKERLDQALEMRAQAQEEINRYAQRYRRARSDQSKTRWLKEWHLKQWIFDVVNETVPARYRGELENRSWLPGASREGKAVEELRNKGVLPAGSPDSWSG